ncbi:MAG TPA: NrsF family protein, partial [Vicinamibacterales bacterium]|nr:NrsF family protein [Vicinamibacterales bacterium]
MADERLDLPPALRAAIARDLRPVAPLPAPARRVLSVVPVAVAVVVATLAIFGLRRDAPRLGFGLTWIASSLQLCLGLALTMAALREAVPGTALSRRAIGLVLGTGIITTVTITFMT